MKIWQLLQHKIPEGQVNRMEAGIPKLPEIFQAKVTEQLSGALFAVQKGGLSFSARISGTVESGKEYVFHSRQDELGIVLTVERSIPANGNSSASSAHPTPLNRTPPISATEPLQAPTAQRLEEYIKEVDVKLSQGALEQLTKKIDSYAGIKREMAMELTKFMVVRHADSTESIMKNLQLVTSALLEDENLAGNFEKVKQMITVSSESSAEEIKLLAQLDKATAPSTLQSPKEMVQFLKNIFAITGLDYENILYNRLQQHLPLSSVQLDQLKPLLLQFEKLMLNKEENSTISNLVSKITGFQLLSRDEGSFQHLFLPIPVLLENEAKEWYVHMTSKKKDGEGIDPEYCRIVLYLDLPVFSTTLVDLLVQQKVISLSIHHSYTPLGTLVEKGLPLLKGNLSMKGYTLSAVKTIPSKIEKSDEIPLEFLRKILDASDGGVDIRI